MLKSFVIVILTTIAIRGGIQDKPINIINAGEYTEPEYFPIVVNTPFTLLKTIDESALQEIEYFKDEKLIDFVSTLTHYIDAPLEKVSGGAAIVACLSYLIYGGGYLPKTAGIPFTEAMRKLIEKKGRHCFNEP